VPVLARVPRFRVLSRATPWDRVSTMKWVTRERPKTDRIACPWLIRGFIDPDAEIVYVPTAEVLSVAQPDDARSFDAPGADYTHRGSRCSFEVLIDEFDLGDDAALVRLAQIVHAADVSEDRGADPLGAGLEAIGLGGLDVEDDDLRSSMTRSTHGVSATSRTPDNRGFVFELERGIEPRTPSLPWRCSAV
jgi:hypothetical protein